MFNQHIKEEFIASEKDGYQIASELAEAVFSVSEAYEEEVGTDLHAMTRPDLLRAVSAVLEKIARTSWPDDTGLREEILKVLRAYGKWSLRQRFANCTNDLITLEDPMAIRYRTRFSANPIHLRQQLNDLFPLSEEYGTINDTFHCFFWMAFAGIEETAAIRLTSDHADFRRMCFCIDGETYPIYAEGFPSVWNAIHCEQFQIVHPNYTKISVKNRASGDLILRGFTQKISTSRIGSDMRITQAKFKTDMTAPNLNYRNIRYSGAFYRAYMCEMAGMSVDFTEIARSNMPQRGQAAAGSDKRNLWHKTQEIKSGYHIWKCAFVMNK